jgi:hypothetical protein
VLVDCGLPGATALWSVPLTEEMAGYLAEPDAAPALSTVRTQPSGRSKLGLHVAVNNDPAIMEFIRAAKPAVVVAVGGLTWMKDVKAASPKTITVGRLIEGDQSFVGDPAVRAQAFVQSHAAEYLDNTGVDYWLGWNEPAVDYPWQMAWYAAFEAERTVAMASLGLHVAIGNFAVGNPEANEFTAFLPAIAAARQYGGILALHEYSAPTLSTGVGMGIPGMEADEDSGALTLRYRYWYEHYLRPNDLVVPLIITEAGIDGGVLRENDANLLGWRDFYSDTPESDEVRLASQEEAQTDYVGQLSWYDDQLRRDPYVLGFAIFNAGDLSGRWSSFDVTSILPQLANLVNSKP